MVLSFYTKDLTAELLPHQEHFDHSKLPADHPLYSTVNKGVVGKFKDETNGVPILEFIGLKAKMYSYKLASVKEEEAVGESFRKAKGIPKSVVERDLTHDMYRRCALGEIMKPVTIHSLVSKSHLVYKTESQKQSLDTLNTKRWLTADKNHTLPYGHALTRTLNYEDPSEVRAGFASSARCPTSSKDVADGDPAP